jgi:hypothetical protein
MPRIRAVGALHALGIDGAAEMKANDLISFMSDAFPFKKKRSLDWVAPASLGIGFGVALGVGLGVLIAPSSGEQTRQRLRQSAERVKERAISAAQRAQEPQQTAAGREAGERSFTDDLGSVR